MADPRALLAGGAERAVRRRSRPGASAAARAPPASSAMPPTGTPRWRPSRCPAGCGSADLAADRGACASCPRSARSSTRARTRPARWVAYAADGALHVVGRRRRPRRDRSPPAEKTRGHLGRGRVRGRRGDGPATAASGGPPTATRCSPPGSTRRPVQRWYIADPAHPETPAAEVRYPVAGSAERRRDAARPRASTAAAPTCTWDRSQLPLPRARLAGRTAGAVVQVMSRDQRRAAGAARSTRPPGRPAAARAVGPVWLDAVAGVPALLPDGRLVGDRRPRRGAPAGRRRRARHRPRRSAGRLRSLSVGDDGVLLPGTDDPTERHLWRWTDPASPPSG